MVGKTPSTPTKITKKGLKGLAAPDLQSPTASGQDDATGIPVDDGATKLLEDADFAADTVASLHETYHARLVLVDTSKNTDKYYIAQVLFLKPLKRTKKGRVSKAEKEAYPACLYTRWGRTGTSGQAKLEGPFATQAESLQAFEKLVFTKTGIAWTTTIATGPPPQPIAGKYEYINASNLLSQQQLQSKGKWFYYLRNDPLRKADGWYAYDDANIVELELVFFDYHAQNQPPRLSSRIVSASNGFNYKVDFLLSQQTNISSGTMRPITRTESGRMPSIRTNPYKKALPLKPPAGSPNPTKAKKQKAPSTPTNLPSPKRLKTTSSPPSTPTAATSPKPSPTKSAAKSPAPATPKKSAASSAPTTPSKSAGFVAKVDETVPTPMRTQCRVTHNVMLNQANIAKNNNKFYKIQALEHTPPAGAASFHVLTRWGRVGENGDNKLLGPFDTEAAAIKKFAQVFRSKTGNSWNDYEDDKDSFVPKKGKYIVLEIVADDQDDDDDTKPMGSPIKMQHGKTTLPCQLDQATQKFMEYIFDDGTFRTYMSSKDLDVDKLQALGKLSPSQIQKGYDVLEEIEEALDGVSMELLSNLTSTFYSVIPHNFGRRRGPIIDTHDKLLDKYNLLDVLQDIEKAQQMQEDSKKEEIQEEDLPPHSADLHYKQLGTDLNLLGPKKDKSELDMITQYMMASTAHQRINITNVWRVNRQGEDKSFAKHDTIDRRILLWHGTSPPVVAAILKSGLRIMPHSGGRVGKGIYLADQFSKSLSYCGWGNGDNVIFLVEAAIGKQYGITRDDSSLTKPPAGYDSVLAFGQIAPPAVKDWEIDGRNVAVPDGIPCDTKVSSKSSFYQSEFLLYQESLHRIRYVLTFQR